MGSFSLAGKPTLLGLTHPLGLGWVQRSAVTLPPAPCVTRTWLAWDDSRSAPWPPQATRKAIWSTCWMGSSTRVPLACSQGTCSSFQAAVSFPKRGKWGTEGGVTPGQLKSHDTRENTGFHTDVT